MEPHIHCRVDSRGPRGAPHVCARRKEASRAGHGKEEVARAASPLQKLNGAQFNLMSKLSKCTSLTGRVPNRNAAPAAPSTVRAGRRRRPVIPQSAGGARAQRVLSAAAEAMAGAVIVRVSQSTDTPAHKRAARNVLERATAAGLVHAAAPARPKRNRGLDSALAAASDATSGGLAGRSMPGEGRSPSVRSVSIIHSEPAASNAEGDVSRDGAELGERGARQCRDLAWQASAALSAFIDSLAHPGLGPACACDRTGPLCHGSCRPGREGGSLRSSAR